MTETAREKLDTYDREFVELEHKLKMTGMTNREICEWMKEQTAIYLPKMIRNLTRN